VFAHSVGFKVMTDCCVYFWIITQYDHVSAVVNFASLATDVNRGRHDGMVNYSRAELCSVDHDRQPARFVRKANFAQRLWLPHRQRIRRSCDVTDVNNSSDHCSVVVDSNASSSLHVGWLNIQSLSSTKRENKTTANHELIS
jgi:hypothetical protein